MHHALDFSSNHRYAGGNDTATHAALVIHTAADARRLAGTRRVLVRPPVSFCGTLDSFIDEYILPDLPDVEAVAAFHDALVEYVSSRDPLYLVRAVSGTTRRERYRTSDGTRFRATDNAPAWWVHAMLVHGGRIAPDAMANVVATMPTHLFDVAATTPPTANAAGWHIAHILPVKDGDTDYPRWRRAEVVRRFVRSVHPCNYFPIAKTGWHRWGGDERVIARFATLYAERYAAVWPAFLALAGARERDLPRVGGIVAYEYGSSDTASIARPRRQTAVESAVHIAGLARPAAATPASGRSDVEYSATRLTFRRDVIEPLRASDAFRIVTPHGTFEMTRAEFYDEFANVAASRSYRDTGVYHYRTVPHRAERFRQ